MTRCPTLDHESGPGHDQHKRHHHDGSIAEPRAAQDGQSETRSGAGARELPIICIMCS